MYIFYFCSEHWLNIFLTYRKNQNYRCKDGMLYPRRQQRWHLFYTCSNDPPFDNAGWTIPESPAKIGKPLVTNGLSNYCHLERPTFIIGSSRVSLFFYFHTNFWWKSCKQTELHKPGRRILRRHIYGYSVFLCPIKKKPCFYWVRGKRLFHKARTSIKFKRDSDIWAASWENQRFAYAKT